MDVKIFFFFFCQVEGACHAPYPSNRSLLLKLGRRHRPVPTPLHQCMHSRNFTADRSDKACNANAAFRARYSLGPLDATDRIGTTYHL